MTKTKQLERDLGGSWWYDKHKEWWCSDDGRTVMAVASCSCDGACQCRTKYICYGPPGIKPKEIFFDDFSLLPKKRLKKF
jgi:hypothetical protein